MYYIADQSVSKTIDTRLYLYNIADQSVAQVHNTRLSVNIMNVLFLLAGVLSHNKRYV